MGSGRGGGRNPNNPNQIPLSSKKVIQSIKEIVNFPEDEIYFMLRDCNMDPYEAVNRLLSQDTFHEVKSKREKKKEIKDVTDSRARGNSSTSTRGGRSGADRYSSRNSATQFVSSDYASQRGKPVYKKETEPPVYRSFTAGVAGNNANSWLTAVSDTSMDQTYTKIATESILPTPQPSGFQSAWSGMPGQVSMADIVKMGRPHGKASSNLNVSQPHINNHDMPPLPAVSTPLDYRVSQNYASKVSEVNSETGYAGHQNVSPSDEWPLDEEPQAATVSSIIEPSLDSGQYNDTYDVANQQYSSQVDDVRYEEDDTVDDGHATYVESVPGSNQNWQENNSVSASGFDNDLYHQNISSYQAHPHEVEDPNVSVSSMTNNFGSLSFPKEDEDTQSEDEDAQSEDDGPAVKIPEHLQVKTADFCHLSFGSFGPVQSNEEEAAIATDAPASVGHSEARNSEYYDDKHLRTASDDAQRINADSGNFEPPSVSQPDMLQQEAPEVTQPSQYSFPPSTDNYTFENSQQLNSSFAHLPASSQMMQGLPSMAGVMPYSSSLPSTLLAANMQTLREAEIAYSQFPISQSMAAKYGNSASSLTGPAASMAELLKTTNLAAQQSQTLPGGNVSGATGLPQHLAMHPYSQHLPLNMMGYPFLPQTYAYMPPAFQQAFAAGNSAYPQSLAAGFPQFKNSVSGNSLPQSGTVPSGYGGFGNSNNIPGDFALNPPSSPSGTSMNYEDVLASQYKDASHLLSLQQQQGAGSRTMSGVPGSTYYSFQGQNQQPPAGFRQSQQQQPSQHYTPGPLSAYPNYYHSQAGMSLDHQQQQMLRDASLGGAQGQHQAQQPKQQTQQHIWQNNY